MVTIWKDYFNIYKAISQLSTIDLMLSTEFSSDLALTILNSEEDFPVDLDDAWQWCGYSSKERATKTLNGYMTDGLDFCTFCEKVTGGRPSAHIRLSIDAFKQLGMLAKSEQGVRIRQYFIECERQLKLATKQQSTADMLMLFAQAFKEQELRLAAIEQDSLDLRERTETLELETQANTAELERFRNGHGHWYSIIGWFSRQGNNTVTSRQASVYGRRAAALCRQRGIAPQPVSDPRYGSVNSYPDYILMEVCI